ncbi:GNAT family N-acetyltransferase [Microvirga terrae]|uniref:GNAT family N-acetyltransferase n=1 Tax=Microvirga terrae TaxID=2740529 RepID=A0ABY5RKB8_9HYPH|nr:MULTISPECIES: GNAT family N-acetyltransferase [Microvirga]MBQ0822988.1 GNAT family N-acetyltransferase [Microvirga sp. HBU67558]UVF17640.1 GNAT family N-acetyltransferase [Microvirga terrae]
MTAFRGSVRPARPGDLTKLAGVERSAASVFRDVGLAWLAEGGTMDSAVLAALCRDETVWVAADERDEPVGFLAAHELDGHLYIAEVSVAASCHRQGIGRRLVEAVIEHGRREEFDAITLTTYRDLPWNGPFYARLGFVEIDPEDARPGHRGKLRAEAEAGHDPARRCLMALKLV